VVVCAWFDVVDNAVSGEEQKPEVSNDIPELGCMSSLQARPSVICLYIALYMTQVLSSTSYLTVNEGIVRLTSFGYYLLQGKVYIMEVDDDVLVFTRRPKSFTEGRKSSKCGIEQRSPG